MRNIIVFGHDPRMESVAGYFIILDMMYENPEEPVADACVITAPKLSEAEEEILCAYMTDDQILYHGLLSAASRQKLQEKGVTCHPYLQLETLVTENAQLTAQESCQSPEEMPCSWKATVLYLDMGIAEKQSQMHLQKPGHMWMLQSDGRN